MKRFLSPTLNWFPALVADAVSSTTLTTARLMNGTTLKTSCVGSANKCLTFRTNCVRLFEVMREIDIKIQKLEKEIMFGKWLAFDPIKDHQLKVRKFNIEKRKLLDAEAQKNKK